MNATPGEHSMGVFWTFSSTSRRFVYFLCTLYARITHSHALYTGRPFPMRRSQTTRPAVVVRTKVVLRKSRELSLPSVLQRSNADVPV